MSTFRTTRLRRTPPPSGDPCQLLRSYSCDLAEAARDVVTRCRGARVCGLIVAPGAVLGTTLRALLWQCHGEADERATCVGLVELSALAELLRSNGSLHAVIAAMRTVPENVLPIVVATATGVRVSSVACRGVGAAASA
jgi:hypothetical protein